MTTDEGIKYDRSLLGKSHNIGTIKVTKEMIIKFSRSTGETNEIHLGNEGTQQTVIAPPTMCNMFVTGASRPDIKLDFGDINLFAGQSTGGYTRGNNAIGKRLFEDRALRQNGIFCLVNNIRESG